MREEDTVCVGSDGLQYCKVCGEAKEAFFPEGGFMGMKKHSRQCACDRKAYEEEQKYFKEKEHRELVSRNTSICFDESRMEEWTFENADMSDAVMHKAKSYVDNWEEMKRNHIGCLFWGPVGTGKSYIAGCIANDLLKREVTVKMTNFNTIIDDIFPLADKTEYINALASYQLLIIDDLGVERNSDLPDSPPELTTTGTFLGLPKDCKFYVPKGRLDVYQTAESWSSYASYMVEMEGDVL